MSVNQSSTNPNNNAGLIVSGIILAVVLVTMLMVYMGSTGSRKPNPGNVNSSAPQPSVSAPQGGNPSMPVGAPQSTTPAGTNKTQ